MAEGDLRPVDVEVYRALLDQSGTTTELGARLGMDVGRLGSVLRGLVAKELVSRSSGRPARFTAVAPEVGLGGLVLRRERELERVRALQAELREWQRRKVRDVDPAELLEVVRGGEEISKRAAQLMRSAVDEVRFVDKPPYAQPPSVLHPVERELLGRGVRFRGVYDRSAVELHHLEADLEAGVALGEQARVVADAPLKMILVDGVRCILPLDSTAPDLGTALVVRPCTLLDALGELFESLWKHAMPFAVHTTPELSVVDSRMLTLLTAGLPDRSIAKQLGLSYRTFQRRLRDLMDALGAQTRFQAGLRAAEQGWVPVDLPPAR
ncbi:helix-turn-helix domain-containing protein [Actinokineospora auranticolor]|nr:helix-turn-helix domain-containing protein [Actinokineospora auranticolor]